MWYHKLMGLILMCVVVFFGALLVGNILFPPSPTAALDELHFQLTDGRNITCIQFSSVERGGLSCDWGD